MKDLRKTEIWEKLKHSKRVFNYYFNDEFNNKKLLKDKVEEVKKELIEIYKNLRIEDNEEKKYIDNLLNELNIFKNNQSLKFNKITIPEIIF